MSFSLSHLVCAMHCRKQMPDSFWEIPLCANHRIEGKCIVCCVCPLRIQVVPVAREPFHFSVQSQLDFNLSEKCVLDEAGWWGEQIFKNVNAISKQFENWACRVNKQQKQEIMGLESGIKILTYRGSIFFLYSLLKITLNAIIQIQNNYSK